MARTNSGASAEATYSDHKLCGCSLHTPSAVSDVGAGQGGGRRPAGAPASAQYQQLANGPAEQVLAFSTNERIVLRGVPDDPYFFSSGVQTDLQHNVLPGMTSRLCFPIKGLDLDAVFTWPREQPAPFEHPPLDSTNTTGHGYSKQAYFFDGEASLLVTVGPSLPKIVRMTRGRAQFWVGSVGVVSQGTGKYEGARGMAVYHGGAYFENWPDTLDRQIERLQQGFEAYIATYFKLILKEERAD
jgi:hypothetical protein